MPTPSADEQESARLYKAHRPLPALRALERAVERATGPGDRAFLLFSVGATYWDKIGDGVRAKAAFLRSYDACQAAPSAPDIPDQIHPNVCENLMLLSESFDEYERWAARLRELRPSADILRGQYPIVVAGRERGTAWSGVLLSLPGGYYDRTDPQKDHGMYGQAAAIFHVLLANRRALRVQREDWVAAAYEYGTLLLRLASDTMRKALAVDASVDPREFIPIVANAVPAVKECQEANAGDKNIAFVLDHMQRWIQGLEETSSEADEKLKAPPAREGRELKRCPHCGVAIAMPAINCPGCGRTLARIPLAWLKGVFAAALVYLGARYALPGVPQWLAIGAAAIVGNIALAASMARDIAGLQRASSPARVSVDLSSTLGANPDREILCRNGHRMRRKQDEGVLLAECQICGIVKPYPNSMMSANAIRKVAEKYENFEF